MAMVSDWDIVDDFSTHTHVTYIFLFFHVHTHLFRPGIKLRRPKLGIPSLYWLKKLHYFLCTVMLSGVVCFFIVFLTLNVL